MPIAATQQIDIVRSFRKRLFSNQSLLKAEPMAQRTFAQAVWMRSQASRSSASEVA
jgi:predicted CoA-binding protein